MSLENEIIATVAAWTGVEAAAISGSTRLVEDLNADSQALVNILDDLGDRYGEQVRLSNANSPYEGPRTVAGLVHRVALRGSPKRTAPHHPESWRKYALLVHSKQGVARVNYATVNQWRGHQLACNESQALVFAALADFNREQP